MYNVFKEINDSITKINIQQETIRKVLEEMELLVMKNIKILKVDGC